MIFNLQAKFVQGTCSKLISENWERMEMRFEKYLLF